METATLSVSPDVQSYAIYRGSNAGFVPSAANVVAVVAANKTTFTDSNGGATDWYKLAAIDVTAASSGFTPPRQVTNPTDTTPPLPQRFALHQNEPNPFNPTTWVRFDLPAGSNVRLEILDARGRVVRVLAEGWRDAGSYQLTWDGSDAAGRPAASGVFFSRLLAGSASATRKMILVR